MIDVYYYRGAVMFWALVLGAIGFGAGWKLRPPASPPLEVGVGVVDVRVRIVDMPNGKACRCAVEDPK